MEGVSGGYDDMMKERWLAMGLGRVSLRGGGDLLVRRC